MKRIATTFLMFKEAICVLHYHIRFKMSSLENIGLGYDLIRNWNIISFKLKSHHKPGCNKSNADGSGRGSGGYNRGRLKLCDGASLVRMVWPCGKQ